MPEQDRSRQDASAAFGQRLREVRTEKGLSQEALGHRTGLHATAIGRLERGRREPRLMSILNLARGLKVPPGELLDTLPGAEDWHDIDPQEGGEA
ncbi:MAG TPA: helix-turn-helix transcriptional regulator [Solirubrobacteraceae bacterium]|jgi:transcriptional regulator with XRE-family HTH domain|nr:helix-turn-helix transcriptional regulator [Solirubrobacteraceae bacterium]